MSNAIEIKNLNKTYAGTKKSAPKKAVDDVSLTIPKGKIFGLLGPNGAGKSTIINIMAGLVIKSSGTVKINGYDIDQNIRAAKRSIGIVPQEINADPFFTPKKLLDIQAGFYGVPKSERRTDEILDIVGLKDKSNAYARMLSGGMKRRLLVAKAMVHSPSILVLDEPTAGVDVELRKRLWDNVLELNRKGTTILLTTHYLEEAEELCDDIAIIDKGKIIANEPTKKLLKRIDAKEIIFTLDKKLKTPPKALEKYHPEITEDNSLKLRYSEKDDCIESIIATINKAGYHIKDITTDQSDLEDIFVQLTGS